MEERFKLDPENEKSVCWEGEGEGEGKGGWEKGKGKGEEKGKDGWIVLSSNFSFQKKTISIVTSNNILSYLFDVAI